MFLWMCLNCSGMSKGVTLANMHSIFLFCYLYEQNGFTPLHIGAKKNRIDIVLLLLKNGVDPDVATQVTIHGVKKFMIMTKVFSDPQKIISNKLSENFFVFIVSCFWWFFQINSFF